MEKAIKFFGVCFLISAILISTSWMYSTISNNKLERYKIVKTNDAPAIVLDSYNGDTYYMYIGGKPVEISKIPK